MRKTPHVTGSGAHLPGPEEHVPRLERTVELGQQDAVVQVDEMPIVPLQGPVSGQGAGGDA